MLILFLDDSEERQKLVLAYFEAVYSTEEFALLFAKDAQTAIEYLQAVEEPWNLVMLDHDLGKEIFMDSDRMDTGMEVVRWIVRNRPLIEKIIIHSWNSPAAEEMIARLRAAGYEEVLYQPFSYEQ